MENTNAVATANVEKRILVTAKGFSPLGEKGVNNLIKVCNDFLSSGKCVWSMADYMGITGAGKIGGKGQQFLAQLEANSDVEACKTLQDLVPAVITKMADPSFGLVIEKPALQAYFQPLLKARSTEKVEPTVENLAGLDAIAEAFSEEN